MRQYSSHASDLSNLRGANRIVYTVLFDITYGSELPDAVPP